MGINIELDGVVITKTVSSDLTVFKTQDEIDFEVILKTKKSWIMLGNGFLNKNIEVCFEGNTYDLWISLFCLCFFLVESRCPTKFWHMNLDATFSYSRRECTKSLKSFFFAQKVVTTFFINRQHLPIRQVSSINYIFEITTVSQIFLLIHKDKCLINTKYFMFK